MDDKTTQIPVSSPDEVSPDAVIDSNGAMQDAPAATAPVNQPVAPNSVMDVTPPPHDSVSAPSAPAVPTVPVAQEESMPSLAPEPAAEVAQEPAPEAPAVSEAPVAEASVAEMAVPPADPLQTNIAPAVVTPTGAEKAPDAAKPKKSGKGMMIIVAVILALVLASAAVLFYLRSKDNKTAVKPSSTTSKTTAAATKENTVAASPVSTTDVDSATKNVDTNLNGLDENKDFSSDTLSDKSLGLQ